MTDNRRDDQILTPDASVITVGDKRYVITKFCLAKSMRMLKMLTNVSDAVGIGGLVAVAETNGWIVAFADALPRIMSSLEPELFRLMSLVVIPNRRLFELIDEDKSIDDEINRVAKELMTNEALDIGKAIEIVQIGYERIGLEALQANFRNLLAKVERAAAPAETAAEEQTTNSG